MYQKGEPEVRRERKDVTNWFKSPMGKKYNRMSVHSIKVDYVPMVKKETTGPKRNHLC